jgi:hypothetical protein
LTYFSTWSCNLIGRQDSGLLSFEYLNQVVSYAHNCLELAIMVKISSNKPSQVIKSSVKPSQCLIINPMSSSSSSAAAAAALSIQPRPLAFADYRSAVSLIRKHL